MFLSELSLEEKKAFLEIANELISADNIKTDEEISMILQYKKEMNLSEEDYKIGTIGYESALEKLKIIDIVKQKKIFFELIALALCDNDYSNQEKEYIEKLQKSFSISDEQLTGFINCVEDINKVYKKLGELISEEQNF